jgi:hypothetical protein
MAQPGAILPVHEVVAIVRQWVEQHARHWPDFAGAYLWGGITALPADAPFPLYRDVDVVVVLATDTAADEQEVFFGGLSLEIIGKTLAEHHDAAAVLANPSAGPNVATTQILADPTGILGTLQRAVAAEYGWRRWVQARCAAERAAAAAGLVAMRQATTPAARGDAVRDVLMAVSGLLAVAELKRPTTRRTLALLHELLAAHGRADLQEIALVVMGSAALDVAAVERLLDQTIAAFDRAAAVNRTPVPYGFAIQAHLRPYYLAGTREMIDQGLHREAVFWIACLDTIYFVLENDAPQAEKAGFAAQHRALYATLGYTSEAWGARVAAAEGLAAAISQLADGIAALHPDEGPPPPDLDQA